MSYTEEEKKYLLSVARKSIEEHLSGRKYEPPEPPTSKLKEKRACFVTLKRYGKLRGCIGLIEPVMPLYKAVSEMAISAAFKDPRFFPLTKEEMEGLKIEISILTPFKKISSPEEIEVGRDGLYIRKGFYSGLLLPQVAVEWGWDRYEFLRQVCYKAGLGPDDWKNAEIYTFQAEIIEE